ncbi:MarR family winged helix-turn-helix transcriptional regulator [Amycolatopsis sp. PS_44_ISF1]|uniref:MarR family winged helix-turn-helix transcriptional regulator n=1 Tax=Amycolatopsis sp. PS_44_ISF1 TaxID=2974917 RepID=UPI0028DEDF92|nr:MarR family winged helix-turn-helix transcriptional regulator [Amycolatopsis sp. PS_44_ISF1]MDT8911253.1 MarR family winged helix-turn-helix transcriptional regulator [Amycolatopsis sp. PS_44_ISF1]
MTTGSGPTVADGVRELLLLVPRLVARAKKLPVPAQLAELSLAPRHLSLLSCLLFDGPMTVTELAGRLEVAPTTASLMVGDLSRQGLLDRAEDPHDRRRTIVSVNEEKRCAVDAWLAHGARAWERALTPLTPAERGLVIRTLRAYERNVEECCPDR